MYLLNTSAQTRCDTKSVFKFNRFEFRVFLFILDWLQSIYWRKIEINPTLCKYENMTTPFIQLMYLSIYKDNMKILLHFLTIFQVLLLCNVILSKKLLFGYTSALLRGMKGQMRVKTFFSYPTKEYFK